MPATLLQQLPCHNRKYCCVLELPIAASLQQPEHRHTSSPACTPARSAGPPEMEASTTRRPLWGSEAMSSPTPWTSPSEDTLKSWYSLHQHEGVGHMQ